MNREAHVDLLVQALRDAGYLAQKSGEIVYQMSLTFPVLRVDVITDASPMNVEDVCSKKPFKYFTTPDLKRYIYVDDSLTLLYFRVRRRTAHRFFIRTVDPKKRGLIQYIKNLFSRLAT